MPGMETSSPPNSSSGETVRLIPIIEIPQSGRKIGKQGKDIHPNSNPQTQKKTTGFDHQHTTKHQILNQIGSTIQVLLVQKSAHAQTHNGTSSPLTPIKRSLLSQITKIPTNTHNPPSCFYTIPSCSYTNTSIPIFLFFSSFSPLVVPPKPKTQNPHTSPTNHF